MEGAAGVLVIILSIFLAIFLLLFIVLLVFLIKISRQIKSVTRAAQTTAEGIEKTVTNFSLASSPLAVAKIVKNIISTIKKS